MPKVRNIGLLISNLVIPKYCVQYYLTKMYIIILPFMQNFLNYSGFRLDKMYVIEFGCKQILYQITQIEIRYILGNYISRIMYYYIPITHITQNLKTFEIKMINDDIIHQLDYSGRRFGEKVLFLLHFNLLNYMKDTIISLEKFYEIKYFFD